MSRASPFSRPSRPPFLLWRLLPLPRGPPQNQLTHSLPRSKFIHSPMHAWTRSFISVGKSTLPFIRSLIHSFSHWFIHSFTDACTQRWAVTDRGSAAGPRRQGGTWEGECRAPGGERAGKGSPGKWQRGGLQYAVFRKGERRPEEGPSASPPEQGTSQGPQDGWGPSPLSRARIPWNSPAFHGGLLSPAGPGPCFPGS